MYSKVSKLEQINSSETLTKDIIQETLYYLHKIELDCIKSEMHNPSETQNTENGLFTEVIQNQGDDYEPETDSLEGSKVI